MRELADLAVFVCGFFWCCVYMTEAAFLVEGGGSKSRSTCSAMAGSRLTVLNTSAIMHTKPGNI